MKELSPLGLVALAICTFALLVLVWGGIQHMLDSIPMGEEDETGFHLIDENKNEVINQEEVERTPVHETAVRGSVGASPVQDSDGNSPACEDEDAPNGCDHKWRSCGGGFSKCALCGEEKEW